MSYDETKSFTFMDSEGNLVLRSPDGDTILVPHDSPMVVPERINELVGELVTSIEVMAKIFNDIGIPVPASVAYVLSKVDSTMSKFR